MFKETDGAFFTIDMRATDFPASELNRAAGCTPATVASWLGSNTFNTGLVLRVRYPKVNKLCRRRLAVDARPHSHRDCAAFVTEPRRNYRSKPASRAARGNNQQLIG